MRYMSRPGKRRGAVLPFVAFCIIFLLAMVALAIDIGIIAIAKNQCQNAADAACMAGCRTINGDEDNNYNFDKVPEMAIKAANNNYILGSKIEGNPNTDWGSPDDASSTHPDNHIFNSGQVSVEVGSYTYFYNDTNPSEEGFKLLIPRTNTEEPYSAVKTTISYNGGLNFGRLLGMNSFNAGAAAVAIHRPRDVVIIMDLSGSMRFQSLPARPYYNSRTDSMNPESIFPTFRHYSDISGAELQGDNNPVKTGSGEYYDPCNLTIKTDSGPPIAEYFFQNHSDEDPDFAKNRAFTRAPDNYASGPVGPQGGDNYLYVNKNTGSNYAKTVEDIVGDDPDEILGFERYGYDYYYQQIDSTWKFQGYIQGPGYWGKTFFIWPPDPRGADPDKDANNSSHHVDNGAKDWRQRFFIKDHYYSSNDGWMDHNSVFWRKDYYSRPHTPMHPDSTDVTQEEVGQRTYNYKINYAAILKWLDTDPKPFPPRLRAGRIKYYDAFPNYNDTTLNQRWWNTQTSSLSDLNERFWKGYIDFVIGVMWRNGPDHYSVRNSDSIWSGTYIQNMIGNGAPFHWDSWSSENIDQKPLPEDPEQGGDVQKSGGYDAGHTDWIRLGHLDPVKKPQEGDFIVFLSDPARTVYKIDEVRNYNHGQRRVEIKTDIPLKTSVIDNGDIEIFEEYPFPYMDYNDNPRRPKHHYWFGPMTMIDYLGNYNMGQYWWPGNVPEAQAWSC